MATAILTNERGFTNRKRSKISLANQKKEFSMVTKRTQLDFVTPKERMSVPFRYRMLVLKTFLKSLLIGVTL